MKKFLALPWTVVKALFFLAFPMARGGTTVAATGGSAAKWLARSALLAVFLLGLYGLNQWERLALKYWLPPGRISNYWLPALASCVYAMVWLGWLLVRVLDIDVGPVTSEFGDIDKAWSQALDALGRANIRLEETPLFLVLGWTADGEGALFHATGFKAQIKQVPTDPTEPLHVTANGDAIWVSCIGVSALAQHNPALMGGEAPDATLDTLAEQPADALKTIIGKVFETIGIDEIIAPLRKLQPRTRSAHRQPTVVDTAKYGARLRYLCRLIARDRQGLCPINGVLVVLPITAANSEAGLDELAKGCRADLSETFGTLPVRCPVLVLVSDLEKLKGFTRVAEQLPPDKRGRGMGQRFPLVPDLEDGAVPGSIESSVSWVGSTLFPAMVYSLFKIESPGDEDATAVLQANSQLYRFLLEMRDRQERVARLVKESIPALPSEPILFRGCYFAGTGVSAGNGQAFASGILTRLIKAQDNVTWTRDALDDDASLLRLAQGMRIFFLGMIGLGLLAIMVLVGLRLYARWTAESQADEPNTVLLSPMITSPAHPRRRCPFLMAGAGRGLAGPSDRMGRLPPFCRFGPCLPSCTQPDRPRAPDRETRRFHPA
jgi:hypothetical protein